MNIFLCEKCDKLNEEKTINLNNNSENNKYNNTIYYCNSLYNSYISSIKNINELNNESYKLQNQEEELQIIEYPYEKKKESQNNYSKSTLKQYNFDINENISEINSQLKSSSIKKLFSTLNKQKPVNKKKNILLNNDSLKKNNNYEIYFLKNNQKQNLTNSSDLKVNNNNKRNSKNKSKLNKVILNKYLKLEDNNPQNNSWTQIRTNNSFLQKRISFNNKKKNDYKLKNSNKKIEKRNRSSKNKYKNKYIIINNIKGKNNNNILIDKIISKNVKTTNSFINKKSNLNI